MIVVNMPTGYFGSQKTRATRREVPLAPAVVRELKNLNSRSAEYSPEALTSQLSSDANTAESRRAAPQRVKRVCVATILS
jgi:hypothetical protein